MESKKTEPIQIRVSKETKEDLKQLAKILGISLTDLLVWSALYPQRIEAFKGGFRNEM